MPLNMPHLCGGASPILEARRKNEAGLSGCAMNDQQRLIANWLRDVMERRSLSGRAWAEMAGLGKDTVTRALRENYGNMTSSRTLAKLADAVGEKAPGAAAGVPSSEILAEILRTVLAAADAPAMADDLISAMGQALREVLLHLADDPEAAADLAQSRAVARAVSRRIAQ